MISSNDKDGDGKLSEVEAPEQMKANFAEIDADKDGFVTAEEMAARFARRQEGGGPPGGAPGNGGPPVGGQRP